MIFTLPSVIMRYKIPAKTYPLSTLHSLQPQTSHGDPTRVRFRTRPSQNLFLRRRRRRHNPQPESSSNPANLPPILQPKLHLLLSRTPKRVPDLRHGPIQTLIPPRHRHTRRHRNGRHALPQQHLLPSLWRTRPYLPQKQSDDLGRPCFPVYRRIVIQVRGQKRKTSPRYDCSGIEPKDICL